MQGILRVAMAVPHLSLGDVRGNVQAHLDMIRRAKEMNAGLIIFPELSLTGATCGDLFFQQTLLDEVRAGVSAIAEECPEGITAVLGAPIAMSDGLYNCAVVVNSTGVNGVVPKTCLSADLGEKRWFRSAAVKFPKWVSLNYNTALVQQPIVFQSDDNVHIGIEIGSDLFAPVQPGMTAALAGAEVIINISAMSELVGRRAFLRDTVVQQSARQQSAYVYVSAGLGESSSDLVFAGYTAAASCGDLLWENKQFIADDYMQTVDIDVERIRAARRRNAYYNDAALIDREQVEHVSLDERILLPEDIAPAIAVSKQPFIPQAKEARVERCGQIFALQAAGLARRMRVTGGKAVIGVSGGLDSTLALLVACKAADQLGLPRTNILGVTMPCFGTTDHTYNNALTLMRTLGIEQREIPIHEAVRLHFRDIGHDEKDHSVTYENAQARERTQVLMDVANDFGGIVVGTGDLSEIALGWCTYNADHMSMYGVNCGVPKTLVRWVTRTAADEAEFAASRDVLLSILDTPISPELLPPDEAGNIAQQTEDLVGPYALHDFFLFYAIRYGYAPQRIFDLCCMAFKDDFDRATIHKWLRNFYRRFFTQQFKRNCSPEGMKIGPVGLSPRGDWVMPSDAQASIWLKQVDAIKV